MSRRPCTDSITAKQQETETKLGDTFDSYKANESALTDWYAFVDSESKALYGKVVDSSVKYMQTLSQKASADKYLDADALLDDFYKTVYEDGFETYYDRQLGQVHADTVAEGERG